MRMGTQVHQFSSDRKSAALYAERRLHMGDAVDGELRLGAAALFFAFGDLLWLKVKHRGDSWSCLMAAAVWATEHKNAWSNGYITQTRVVTLVF